MDIKSILKRSRLFSGLTDQDIDEIEAISTSKKYPKGASFFFEDEEAEGFYLVASGKVKVYKLSSEGKEEILHVVSPGETFGEVALFAGSTYPAFSESLAETHVLYFSKERFLGLIRKKLQLGLNLIAGLSLWLRKFVNLAEELSLKDVPARLSSYLLDLSTKLGRSSERGIVFELDITKGQLASRLGTINETLSRVLGKLRDKGIIEVEGKKITILQKQVLEDISSGTPL